MMEEPQNKMPSSKRRTRQQQKQQKENTHDKKRKRRIRGRFLLPQYNQTIAFMIIGYATLATVTLMLPPLSIVEAAAAATTDTLSSPAASVCLSLKSTSPTTDYLNTDSSTISDYTPTNLLYRHHRRCRTNCLKNLSSFKSASIKFMEHMKNEPHFHSSGFMPPNDDDDNDNETTSISKIRGGSTVKLKQQKQNTKRKSRANNTGFYYGLREDIFLPNTKKYSSLPQSPSSSSSSSPLRNMKRKPFSRSPPPPPLTTTTSSSSSGSLADVMGEALVELREMREEIAALRDEMKYMKQRVQLEREKQGLTFSEDDDAKQQQLRAHHHSEGEYEDDELAHPPHGHGVGSIVSRLKRQREFDRIGLEVEEWAHACLFEEGGEEDGWKEIKCNKFVRNKFNKDGSTTCFMKWMPDQRGRHASPQNANRKFPCIKCYSTINAPFEDVCAYLAEENNMSSYNELVVGYRDLEEITPHSKICWSQCPQALFIKSRDFVTFCHLKWKRDGTQVVINQACEHEDAPGVHEEKEGHMCRAFALRGANFIQRDPDNPEKTRFAILAHADPGGGLPDWAIKTAVNAVAPIEPFKLFHNINSKIIEAGPAPPRAEMVSSLPGRSARPGGLSQLGYACFWPHGGGGERGFLAS